MRVLAFAAVALVALAGCASSTTDSSSGAPSSSTEPTHDHTAKTIDVSMTGNKFVNATIVIYEGDTVKWTHNDAGTTPPRAHNVHADDNSFNSSPMCGNTPPNLPTTANNICMSSGQTFSKAFTTAGNFTYKCDIHAGSGMTGTVVVMHHPA